MNSNRHHNDPSAKPYGNEPSRIHSRRSLRKATFVPIWLRNDGHHPTWEEETETLVVSRYGAGLRCRHSIQAGNIVVILRRDNGRRATARVTYVRYDADGKRELGIEFIDRDNFWDLAWNPTEPEPVQSPAELTQTHPYPEGPSPEAIRSRAYMIYLERGARGGHDLEDWLEAERELKGTLPSRC